MIRRREPPRRKPAHFFVTRVISVPFGVVDREIPRAPVLCVDRPERFVARSAERANRFLPMTFSCTMAPRAVPPASRICNVDLKIFAGRTISSSFVPSAS